MTQVHTSMGDLYQFQPHGQESFMDIPKLCKAAGLTHISVPSARLGVNEATMQEAGWIYREMMVPQQGWGQYEWAYGITKAATYNYTKMHTRTLTLDGSNNVIIKEWPAADTDKPIWTAAMAPMYDLYICIDPK